VGGVFPLSVTSTAASKIAELLHSEASPDLYLRVAVRPGGCSGFSYELFFDGETPTGGDLVDESCGVKVVVDDASAQLLQGATLDYRDGLNQAGFSLKNPNAARTCGCGQSFS